MDNDNKNQDKFIESRLSGAEKDLVVAFCKNEKMVVAVEKVLMSAIYQMGTVVPEDIEVPTINWAFALANADLSNEEKGKKLDVMVNAISVLKGGFDTLRKLGVPKVQEEKSKNPAV